MTASDGQFIGSDDITIRIAPIITSTPVRTPAWSQVAATGAPPPPGSTAGGGVQAYDEVNDRLLVFPGLPSPSGRPDSWVLTNASGRSGAPAWIQLPLAAGPSARSFHGATYAASSNRLIVHGGVTSGPLLDTWVLTNANGLGGMPAWLRLPDMPVGRYAHASAYNPGSNRLIVFSGYKSGDQRSNDVLVLTDADGNGAPAWLTLSPGGQLPPAREMSGAVYDPLTNRLLVVGGRSSAGPLDDVWVLTNANGLGGTPEWVQLLPVGSRPMGRRAHSVVYNAVTNEAMIFGGEGPSGATLNDTWLLTNANGVGGTARWSRVDPVGQLPPDCRFHRASSLPASNAMLVALGQRVFSGQAFNHQDVWTLGPPLPSAAVGRSTYTTSTRPVTSRSSTRWQRLPAG